jgi:hypothetical protein
MIAGREGLHFGAVMYPEVNPTPFLAIESMCGVGINSSPYHETLP